MTASLNREDSARVREWLRTKLRRRTLFGEFHHEVPTAAVLSRMAQGCEDWLLADWLTLVHDTPRPNPCPEDPFRVDYEFRTDVISVHFPQWLCALLRCRHMHLRVHPAYAAMTEEFGPTADTPDQPP